MVLHFSTVIALTMQSKQQKRAWEHTSFMPTEALIHLREARQMLFTALNLPATALIK